MEDRRPDEELLAATSEPAAFATFYRRHERRILAYFAGRLREAEVAADLTAETFAAALLAREGHDRDQGPGVAWLYGIAHHVLLMSLRRGRVEQKARSRLAMPPLDLTDELIERIDALRGEALRALADLTDDQRQAVEARV